MMPYREIRWRYDVDHGLQRSLWDQCGHAETLWKVLKEEVGVLGLGYVEKAWTRGRVKGKGRQEALKFLNDIDETFKRLDADKSEDLKASWAKEMPRLEAAVEKW
jgi:hypothetical protein